MMVRMYVWGRRGRMETRRLTGKTEVRAYSGNSEAARDRVHYGLVEHYRRRYAGVESKETHWIHVTEVIALDTDARAVVDACRAEVRLSNEAAL